MHLIHLGSRSASLLLLISFFVVGIIVACGGSTEPEPTSAPAPTAVPDEQAEPTVLPTTSESSGRDWNILGSPDALVTVLDYSDFQ